MRISLIKNSFLIFFLIFSLSGCQKASEDVHRGEEQTYLTLPEWNIVYISKEYAEYIKNKPPSGFSYFSSIGQFWDNYHKVYQLTKKRYPFNTGYHVMIVVIGISTTLEYGFKGVYENSIGRLTELTRTHGLTEEDIFAYNTAQDYVNFINIYPWYEYPYFKKLFQLWRNTSFIGADQIRKTERKMILSAEYTFKGVYGWVIKILSRISYDIPSPITVTVVTPVPERIFKEDTQIKLLKNLDKNTQLISLPRYDAFKNVAAELAKNGVEFKEIAGNSKEILITFITPRRWQYNLISAEELFYQNIPSESNFKRIAIKTSVNSLSTVITELDQQNIQLEHIYDY